VENISNGKFTGKLRRSGDKISYTCSPKLHTLLEKCISNLEKKWKVHEEISN